MRKSIWIIVISIFASIFIWTNVHASENIPPQVKVYNSSNFEKQFEFIPFDKNFEGGVNVALGDIDGDSEDEIITGAGPGGAAQVRIYESDGSYTGRDFYPFHPDYRGGVNVAAGDMDGDGIDELIFGQAALGEPRIKVYKNSGKIYSEFLAYNTGVEFGVNISAGDINNDGKDEIITGSGRKGGPHVRVFNGKGNPTAINLYPFHPEFRGGIWVGIGDVNGDGRNEIVTSQAGEGEAWVRIYKPNTGEILADSRLYPPNVESGVKFSIADINNDGREDIVSGAGLGGGPQIRYYNYSKHKIELFSAGIMSFDEKSRYGVNVATGDLNGNGRTELVAGTGNPRPLKMWDVNLNVPLYKQEKSLSCEAASLRMALGYKGVNISEEDLINRIGFDGTPKHGDKWGDPQYAFVGNIRGRQMSSGYGVYWEPIQRIASEMRSSYYFKDMGLQEMLEEVSDGNPVVVWGAKNNRYYPVYWKTVFEKLIYAVSGEHARVVKGFQGHISNPSHIIANDPAYGEQYWAVGDFMENWKFFNNSGVVVE